jgi:predicted transcriptional regulator YdeE
MLRKLSAELISREKFEVIKMKVIGIKAIVTNAQMQAIGAVWEKFYSDRITDKIKNIVSKDVVAVYTDYTGDHTMPYTMFIGHEVDQIPKSLKGLYSVEFSSDNHTSYTIKGKIPDVVIEKWQEIWQSGLKRKFNADYGHN